MYIVHVENIHKEIVEETNILLIPLKIHVDSYDM